MAEEKKSVMDKIKEKFDDKEEQFEYISGAVRLLVVFWSGLLVRAISCLRFQVLQQEKSRILHFQPVC